ncbi:hypothetical protein P3T37_005014 [Kitasatospora sp. MAA4]|uniref:DUF3515 domain-containing protein n=1 Tax=Kitasatospora sp. MAA4 TaxID=3035093 RepID=UPI00247378E2|nr:DUF3515 domain-containing protein [Kitasatospora sp. MAA4]MDH6135598.1 hypothetical protein [Kitasatospora sp. MAA4]
MARFQRPIRALAALPAPVRWLSLPLGLLACSALLFQSWGSWQPPLTAPTPTGAVAGYCQALAKALPGAIEGHQRTAPDPSPYVAVWNSSPRTVLRCGVPRPKSLNKQANQESTGPNVNNVQWYLEKDGHGGYRFTATLRLAYVEVSVPAGAYPNYGDPLSPVSDAVNATVPDISGQLGGTDDSSD